MILKVGSKGEDVKQLQQKLGLGADGIFGRGTEEAVKAFQLKNGLNPDGIVGPNTWQKIMGQGITTPQVAPQVASQVAPQVGGLKLEKLKGHIPDNVIAQIPDILRNQDWLSHIKEILRRLQVEFMGEEWEMDLSQQEKVLNLEVEDIFS